MKRLCNIYIKDQFILGEDHKFVLLHHFKIVNNNYFKTYNEFLYSIDKNKYSVFGYFDDDFRIKRTKNSEEKFVFLLEYPDIGYIYFEQKENPLTTSDDSVVDMNILNSTLPEGNQSFSGLTQYDGKYNSTFLDGLNKETNPDDWFYAIGQKIPWKDDQIPVFTSSNEPKITEVYLWIEYQYSSIFDKFKDLFYCKTYNQYDLNFRSLILIMIICSSKNAHIT